MGVSADGLYSKGLYDIRLDDVDYMINLTDVKVAGLIPASFTGKLISCFVRDPYGHGIDSFRSARDELLRLVKEKLPGLIAG
jgi:hypothetical protein